MEVLLARTLFLALLALSCKKAAPPQVVDPLAQPLPVDEGVLHGTWDNGMRWFVEPNGDPQGQVVFRLTVDVGSAMEDEDQRGLAHMLEHMAFNGTTAFPGTEVVTYLESLGARFGPHLNAHTGFEETVYKLTVPTDDPDNLTTALKVLQEWACCLTLDPDAIEGERGVVLEEWRRRLGPSSRIGDRTVPVTYAGSAYADRLPIGTEDSLRSFTPEALTRFRDDWYRPERMAVIAVGDIDPAWMAAQLTAHFAELDAPGEARERPTFSLPDHPPQHLVITDPEITRTTLSILHKRDQAEPRTVGDYRASLLRQVGLAVLRERLAAIARLPSAPWLSASATEQILMRGELGELVSAQAPEGGAVQAYEALLTEVERLRRHGVTADELDRARADLLRAFDSAVQEIDTTASAVHADEIVRHVLRGETMPGTRLEAQLARDFLPELTPAEVGAWAARWMGSTTRVVTVILPEGEAPTVEQLLAVEAEIEAATLAPPLSVEVIGALIDDAPSPGAVVGTDTQYTDTLGFTGIRYANGATVWLKPTDFKADQVVVLARRQGGLSAVPEELLPSAALATEVRRASGLGEHDANAVIRYLQGRRVGIGERVDTYSGQIAGSAAPADLEVALQLVHQMMTDPGSSEQGFELTTQRWREALATRHNDPNTHFQDAWAQLIQPEDPRSRPFNLDQLAQADRQAAEAWYRQVFADPGAFHVLLVGALPEDVESLAATWIGGIPARAEGEGFGVVDRGYRRVKGDHRQVIRRGVEPRARFRTEYWGPLTDNSWERRNRLFVLGNALDVLLRERLREELGGVYGVSVSVTETFRVEDRYTLRIEFTCDPERLDELERATRELIEGVRTEGLPARVVESEIAKNLQSHREARRTNAWWVHSFVGALERGIDPRPLLEAEARLQSLTPEILQSAAREWLVDDRRFTAVLLPEL